MELFILISCVLLLILNIILIGLHVRSRKDSTAREISRSISDLEKVIRDESRYNRENDENRSRKDREELASTLNHFRTEHRETLKNITTQTNSAIQAFQKHGIIQSPATGKIRGTITPPAGALAKHGKETGRDASHRG